MLDETFLKKGVGFDASSYGFTKPERSDMVMIPDLDTMCDRSVPRKENRHFFGYGSFGG